MTLFNRASVAGAVLQIVLWLSQTYSFSKNIEKVLCLNGYSKEALFWQIVPHFNKTYIKNNVYIERWA